MGSAVKVGGQRLYKRARKGETIEREPRPVTVNEFRVLDYTAPDAQIRVRCTSGTYVRSLCHEVGQALECGGVLASLRRTHVGPHAVADAVPLDALTDPDSVARRLLPIGEALDLPQVTVRAASRRIVAAGGALVRKDLEAECTARDGWVQIKSASGDLLALGVVQASPVGLCIQPKRVFVQ